MREEQEVRGHHIWFSERGEGIVSVSAVSFAKKGEICDLDRNKCRIWEKLEEEWGNVYGAMEHFHREELNYDETFEWLHDLPALLNARARVRSLTDYVALRRGKSQISKQGQHLLPGYAQIQEKPVIQFKWLSD